VTFIIESSHLIAILDGGFCVYEVID